MQKAVRIPSDAVGIVYFYVVALGQSSFDFRLATYAQRCHERNLTHTFCDGRASADQYLEAAAALWLTKQKIGRAYTMDLCGLESLFPQTLW